MNNKVLSSCLPVLVEPENAHKHNTPYTYIISTNEINGIQLWYKLVESFFNKMQTNKKIQYFQFYAQLFCGIK